MHIYVIKSHRGNKRMVVVNKTNSKRHILKSHNLILWLTTHVGGTKPRLQFALVHKFYFKSKKLFRNKLAILFWKMIQLSIIFFTSG